MDVDELQQTYDRLRAFSRDHELDWVLAELDEAIATGIIEVREFRQATRKGVATYEELPATGSRQKRSNVEEFISRRPMSLLEQTEALLQALRRVLVDLDNVAEASVTQLRNLPQSRHVDVDATQPPENGDRASSADSGAMVFEIDFAPDEGDCRDNGVNELAGCH